MRTLSRRLSIAAALVVLSGTAACDDLLGNDSPADIPAVRVLSEYVAPGTAVLLRLTNASATTWGFNDCSSPRLQVRAGTEWVDGPESLAGCTRELSTIRGGGAATVEYYVPVGLADGTYRLRYRFSRDDVEAFAMSNAFEVSSAAVIMLEALAASVDDGAMVQMRLTNLSDATWGYNVCSTGRFERNVNDVWVDAGEPFMLCADYLALLEAHAVRTIDVPVWAGLPTGVYRFRLRFTGSAGESRVAFSGAFLIR
jgi:hypothetical protein